MMKGGFGRDKKESEQDVSKNGRLLRDLVCDLDLLDELAVRLDSTHHHRVKNWKHLALVLGLSPRNIADMEWVQGPHFAPLLSGGLIEYLCVVNPGLTVRRFRELLQKIYRHDAVATLDRYIFNPTGECIGDVRDNQDLMVYLTALLDIERYPGMKTWKDLAAALDVPQRVIMQMEQPTISATKELLNYVAAVKPDLTLNHFKSALQEINRRDLVAIIDDYFNTSKVPVRENVLSELQQITWDTKIMDAKNVSSNMERIAVKRGFKVSDNPGSGDCMFYALSEQLERVKKIRIPHDEVRKNLVQFLKENPNLPDGSKRFTFVTDFPSWASYLENMGREGTWGDHIMLDAAANRYGVSIRVISLLLERPDVVIVPSCHVVERELIVGHIQELHYVSLLPQKVPVEIRAGGPLFWNAYKEALAGGNIRVMRLPIMVIGQYRSGKTSLIKSLKGEKFNPSEDPTDRIKKDPNLFGLSRNLWSIEEKGESDFSNWYEHRLSKHLASILRKKQDDESSQMIDPKSGDQWKNTGIGSRSTEADDANFKRVVQGRSPTPEERTKESVADQTSPKIKIESSTKKHPEEPEEEDSEKVHAVVWDFAGQLVYYATHPVFLSPQAIFLLVSNLSWSPEDKASPVFHQKLNEPREDKNCIKTNADYLDLWFSTVSCLAAGSKATEEKVDKMLPDEWRLPDRLPPVVLVCTHADSPYDPSAEPILLARKTYWLLKDKPYSDHLFKHFFTVNNKTSGSEVKCPEVQRLKKAITAIAYQLPHVKQDIPIKWLTFEKALQSRKDEGRHCIDLEEARQIARECGISDDQHAGVLKFFHDQRSVIHFGDSEVLKKSVILDVDWLIEVFKKVITVNPYDGMSTNEEKLWKKLQKEGILADELLRIIWNDLQDGESSETLIAIMEKFGLLFLWPSKSGKEYLVPSILMSPPEEEVTKHLAKALFPSLFIRFKRPPSQECSVLGEGQYVPVPLGFFSRLILRFIQWCAEKQSNPSRPKLFQDYASVSIYPDEKCQVVLLRRFSFIELVVVKTNPPERSQVKITRSDIDVCSLLRKLKDMLTSMQKDFCWMKNVEYELSCLCPVCCEGGSFTHCSEHTDCKQEECLHFWSEREFCKSVEPCCEYTSVSSSESISLEAFKPWFIVSDAKEPSTVESLLSFKDSMLSDIIGDVNVMDELARQLDQSICHGERETPSGKYWLQLAAELRMPIDTLIKCQHSFENSPSKFLFEHKESLNPEFTVQNLKDRLGEIPRNDLVNRLDGCRLSDTATLDDLREKHTDTFEIICLQLDHFNNWPALGKKIGISNEKLKQIKTSSSCAETVLEIIEKKNPNVTVKDMCVLSVEMERQDVCEELKKLPDHSTIVDLRSNLDCLEKVAIKLDQETPGLKNWYYFGWKFDIPIADLDSLKPKRNPSPTKRMIEYIVQAEPHLTVRSLIQKLKKIERLDVVTALKKFFCDSADVEAILAQDL